MRHTVKNGKPEIGDIFYNKGVETICLIIGYFNGMYYTLARDETCGYCPKTAFCEGIKLGSTVFVKKWTKEDDKHWTCDDSMMLPAPKDVKEYLNNYGDFKNNFVYFRKILKKKGII